jgi:hypothetical protein
MKISVIEASNYFKGLLILARKDQQIVEPEKELLMRVGKKLGFEREFCENTIREILENTYIVDAPPEFSSQEIAVRFIKDGLSLAVSDGIIHAFEGEWLRTTALQCGMSSEWFEAEKNKALSGCNGPLKLEVDDLTTGI